MTRTLIRIPIKLSVFERESGKMTSYSSSRLKSKIGALSTILRSNYDDSTHYYECEVMYSRKKDSWNVFKFDSTADLKQKLDIFLEPMLLKELLKAGMLDKEYVPNGVK